MEFLAGWLVCGSIAAIWHMVLITLNVGGEADRMGRALQFFPEERKLAVMVLIIILLFICGPFGLADVINTEYKNRRKRRR
ncbi:hypothetical protein GCM10010149_88150 [Nonomuraea roseoviolacea subsp. roseoviolacea]|uniref:hypothetical protein n=1 Tax=Nonomuraea roseoviolacea TaxID=103837 RepID=UPI0031E268D7